MQRANHAGGFSLVELVLALGLSLIVTATIFNFVNGALRRFTAEPVFVERHQRLRVAIDTLTRDALTARLLLPYRAAGASPDPAGTYRPEVVTTVNGESIGAPPIVRSYYVRRDVALGSQLMRAEGASHAVVVDHVDGLTVEYFGEPFTGSADPCSVLDEGAPLVPLTAPELGDGPWCAGDGLPDPFDADLLRVRQVIITVRVVGGAEMRFAVTPRNLSQLR
jgi:hypothetical protein